MTQLWGGRFQEEINALFFRFNQSFTFDFRLMAQDIAASRAYAKGLLAAEILTPTEATTIDDGLAALLHDLERDPKPLYETGLATGMEDVHSFVEAELLKRVGEVAYKLYTGRSRNDQVATDLRLFLREEIDEVEALVTALQRALVGEAEKNAHVALPGYTHLQPAQPILWAHYLLSFHEKLNRDRGRLRDARTRLNVLPLGSGALAGCSYPIDRDLIARELRFAAVSANSLDATNDRDFLIETLSALSQIMVTLSRLAEDLIIYASAEYGYVRLGDQVATGSSLMPQKKNPDALELIRGKAGRVFGHLSAMLTTMKGLPSNYNKDMQEDKEAAFDSLDTVKGSLAVMRLVLETLTIQSARMDHAARGSYLNATELADYLARKGVPFRRAHHTVGAIVLAAESEGKPLEDLPLSQLRGFAAEFEIDVYEALTLDATLAAKNLRGGTAPQRVTEALAAARKDIL